MSDSPRTPGGLVIVASTHKPDPSKLPKPTTVCMVLRQSFLKRTYPCGHRAGRSFKVSVYGSESKWIKQTERCPECFITDIKQRIISCALCGLPIFPGEGIALYAADQDMIRDDATIIERNSAIGCLRMDCCPSGGLFAGHWADEGYKPIDWSTYR